MSYPLKSVMTNGVTVSDWLGTAMTAAKCAARYIDDVREGSMQPYEDIAFALENAEQTVDELRAVMAHVARVAS